MGREGVTLHASRFDEEAQTKSGGQRPPEAECEARARLPEVAAATHVAAAKPTHVAAAKPAHVTAAEAAAAKTAHMAKVSAGEMAPAAMERETIAKAVVEMIPSEEDRTPEVKAVIVIRIWVSVTIVVAGVRPVGIVAAVRIAGGGAGDHAGRNSRARIVPITITVAVSVSPDVMAMAHVPLGDIPMHAMPMHAMRNPGMGSVPIMVSDGGRMGRGKRRNQRDRGCGERNGRSTNRARGHDDVLFKLCDAARREKHPLDFS
jgi:hypothetical protein